MAEFAEVAAGIAHLPGQGRTAWLGSDEHARVDFNTTHKYLEAFDPVA
jgi:hypothetical protein